MSFSVIVPSRNRANLSACAESVRRYEPDAEIVVVDDGLGADGQRVTWEDPLVRECMVISGIKPFVFARNVNLGIKYSCHPITINVEVPEKKTIHEAPRHDGVILLNDDALLGTPNGFSMLAKFAGEHPEVGCVAPATNITGQRLQWPGNRTPEGYRFVETVPYVCVYIPRRTFDRIGLLDERYCADYGVEDRDHTTAMLRAGLKVAVLYDVFVDHGSLRSSFRGNPKTPKSFAKNYELYKKKWGIL